MLMDIVILPLNVGCQNVGSQIQGDENGVSLGAESIISSHRTIITFTTFFSYFFVCYISNIFDGT